MVYETLVHHCGTSDKGAQTVQRDVQSLNRTTFCKSAAYPYALGVVWLDKRPEVFPCVSRGTVIVQHWPTYPKPIFCILSAIPYIYIYIYYCIQKIAGWFAIQLIITISLLCINTAINHTGQYQKQYLSIVDQTVGPTLSLQASASP